MLAARQKSLSSNLAIEPVPYGKLYNSRRTPRAALNLAILLLPHQPACPAHQQHVKLIPVREVLMPSSDDRCPTCDGSGFVARNEQQYPCPTCTPATDIGRPYLTADEPDPTSPLHIARSVAYGLGAAGLIAALALVIITLWH